MPRGVRAGTKRGFYKRQNKARLRKLAGDIRAGNIDPEAVAQAFDSTNRLPDGLIAENLRAGLQYDPHRLARAVEALGTPQKPVRKPRALPLWMGKAALKHLAKAHGGKGEPIHKSLGVEYPYAEDTRVRAYHRQLTNDYGLRGKGELQQQLNEILPEQARVRHPEMGIAIKESLSGYGIPLEVWRSLMRRRFMR